MIQASSTDSLVRWRNRAVVLMFAILALGPATLWQVYLVAPVYLFYSALLVLLAHAAFTIACIKLKKWGYLANAALSILVIGASLTSPTHFAFISVNIRSMPSLTFIAGDTLEALLLVASIQVYRLLASHK